MTIASAHPPSALSQVSLFNLSPDAGSVGLRVGSQGPLDYVSFSSKRTGYIDFDGTVSTSMQAKRADGSTVAASDFPAQSAQRAFTQHLLGKVAETGAYSARMVLLEEYPKSGFCMADSATPAPPGYSDGELDAVKAACPAACGTCTAAPSQAPLTAGPSTTPSLAPTPVPSSVPTTPPTASPVSAAPSAPPKPGVTAAPSSPPSLSPQAAPTKPPQPGPTGAPTGSPQRPSTTSPRQPGAPPPPPQQPSTAAGTGAPVAGSGATYPPAAPSSGDAAPSRAPTQVPTQEPNSIGGGTALTGEEDDDSSTWWIWFLLALLLCCLGGAALWWQRQRRASKGPRLYHDQLDLEEITAGGEADAPWGPGALDADPLRPRPQPADPDSPGFGPGELEADPLRPPLRSGDGGDDGLALGPGHLDAPPLPAPQRPAPDQGPARPQFGPGELDAPALAVPQRPGLLEPDGRGRRPSPRLSFGPGALDAPPLQPPRRRSPSNSMLAGSGSAAPASEMPPGWGPGDLAGMDPVVREAAWLGRLPAAAAAAVGSMRPPDPGLTRALRDCEAAGEQLAADTGEVAAQGGPGAEQLADALSGSGPCWGAGPLDGMEPLLAKAVAAGRVAAVCSKQQQHASAVGGGGSAPNLQRSLSAYLSSLGALERAAEAASARPAAEGVAQLADVLGSGRWGPGELHLDGMRPLPQVTPSERRRRVSAVLEKRAEAEASPGPSPGGGGDTLL
eukprot:TRINITY_DN34698_c0_g1_i3.p1 TRINITY_DN34698_c0_g1~~TRINITY_DN34698_c0_g1_i3.p1  ORF type:complete len:731 (+),score=91.35 TRINITY_DN34698_c0_g1_i3:626-2818(+)